MIREPLEYDAFLAHRYVSRVRGAGGGFPPSLIEKVTEGPATAESYLRDNAERELAAYRSGLLSDLGPRVRAPRLLSSQVENDGRITLWIEEIAHEGPRPLDASALVVASHDLGALAGHWLGRVPAHGWLFTGWIDRHGQPGAVPEALEVLGRSDERVLAVLGAARLAAARELVLAQDSLRPVLESLPVTLCHHDAVGANVFSAAEGTVLIDWESVGPGPVGADLASLLMSPRRGDASAFVVASVFDDAVAAYVDGLDGLVPESLVRRGVDAAIALRWKLARDVAATVESGEDARRGSMPHESPADALAELVELTDLLLTAGARALS